MTRAKLYEPTQSMGCCRCSCVGGSGVGHVFACRICESDTWYVEHTQHTCTHHAGPEHVVVTLGPLHINQQKHMIPQGSPVQNFLQISLHITSAHAVPLLGSTSTMLQQTMAGVPPQT